MRSKAVRRFRLADGLAFVAATAIGLAASRATMPEEFTFRPNWNLASVPPRGGWTPLFVAQVTAELSTIFAIPSLIAWTLAGLALQLRRPRMRWRRSIRRPGMMACLVATMALGLSASVSATSWLLRAEEFHFLSWLSHQIAVGTILTGLAVFWCWATLELVGRWRPESSWVDRLGRLLGAAWVAIALVFGYANRSEIFLWD